MGMFDEIRCEYPLPDGFDDPRHKSFQTKDLDCCLAHYVITKDGTLALEYAGCWGDQEDDSYNPPTKKEPVPQPDFHGTINFYTSNLCGSGHGYVMTSDDEAPWNREYYAKFNSGKLVEITGGLTDRDSSSIHLPRQEWHEKVQVESDKWTLENYNTRHGKAAAFAEAAEILLKEGKNEEAQEQFSNAAQEECGLAKQTHEEPERSALYGQAARWYLAAKKPESALESLTDYFRYYKPWSENDIDGKYKQELVALLKEVADKL